jgi:putative transposase
MIKTYTYKLYNNEKYSSKYDEQISVCRMVYNVAKEVKEESYKKGVSINGFALSKQLTEAKKEFPWLKKVHSQTLQAILERLEEGYKKFFRDLKAGKTCSKPNWAKKSKFQTLTFKQNVKRTVQGFKLPGFGEVKIFNNEYFFDGIIKQAKLTKKADGLYLNVIVEIENIKRENQSNNIISIDMGITRFLTTSDGEVIENPKHLFKKIKELRVTQRKLSRKYQKGKKQSLNYYKQVNVVARLHKQVSDTRKDFLHKVTTDLANNYDLIVVEDLNIQKMVKSSKLAKHILDCSWGMFFELLKSKIEVVKVNPAYSSQECSKCGHTCKENRPTQSIFNCVKCKHTANADDQACIVLLNRYLEGASSFGGNVRQ